MHRPPSLLIHEASSRKRIRRIPFPVTLLEGFATDEAIDHIIETAEEALRTPEKPELRGSSLKMVRLFVVRECPQEEWGMANTSEDKIEILQSQLNERFREIKEDLREVRSKVDNLRSELTSKIDANVGELRDKIEDIHKTMLKQWQFWVSILVSSTVGALVNYLLGRP